MRDNRASLENDEWLHFVEAIETASETAGGDWRAFQVMLSREVAEAAGLPPQEVARYAAHALTGVDVSTIDDLQLCRLAGALADWANRTGQKPAKAGEVYASAFARLDSMAAREQREAKAILERSRPVWPVSRLQHGND